MSTFQMELFQIIKQLNLYNCCRPRALATTKDEALYIRCLKGQPQFIYLYSG